MSRVLLLFGAELILAYAAERADVIVVEIFEFDSFDFFVVNVTAYVAYIFCHSTPPCKIELYIL